MGTSAATSLGIYRRRTPERTALYRCVQQHLDTFLSRLALAEESLPDFVVGELEGFLECGILAYGFARAHCAACGYDRLVAFSCKGRGFCPSCSGRRMSDTAAYLVDAVLPEAPVRQWVLSLPKPLRALCAYDARLCALVLRRFLDAVFTHLRQRAKAELGVSSGSCLTGAVTAVQRFGSAADLNLHFHTLVPDGVFVPGAAVDAAPVFHALPSPSRAEISAVSWRVCERVVALLRRRGQWVDGGDEAAADGEVATGEAARPGDGAALARCVEASLAGSLVFSSGRRPMRLHGAPPTERGGPKSGYGFDIDASRRVSAHDRRGLERLCRYILRPPIATDRLRLLPDGRLELRLKRPWADGTTHLAFDGPELVARLAALVPPPRVHLVRYHGVFAPRSKHRALIVPSPPSRPPACAPPPGEPTGGPATAVDHEQRRQRRLSWQRLMARVFALDVLCCPRCQSGMQLIAFVTHPPSIAAILRSIGLPTAPPERTPAARREWASEQLELGGDAAEWVGD
jgi:hypothetical protein